MTISIRLQFISVFVALAVAAANIAFAGVEVDPGQIVFSSLRPGNWDIFTGLPASGSVDVAVYSRSGDHHADL